MLIFKRTNELQRFLKTTDNEQKTIGFTPTMGALHQGHISLIRQSRKYCQMNVCSIFVNPTQFNDLTDFNKYPKTIERDIEMLHDAGCDVLFLPDVNEVYPTGTALAKPLQFGFIAQTLEGEHRPGHFQGMAQVVERLLKIIKPNKLYMGLKDYQQQLIVAQLIQKLKLSVHLVAAKTVREKDGLAMSSRNVRLSPNDRKLAVQISKTLKQAKRLMQHTDKSIGEIQQLCIDAICNKQGIELEYFEIRNASTLRHPLGKNEKLVALAAVKIGGVRLIDNMLLN